MLFLFSLICDERMNIYKLIAKRDYYITLISEIYTLPNDKIEKYLAFHKEKVVNFRKKPFFKSIFDPCFYGNKLSNYTLREYFFHEKKLVKQDNISDLVSKEVTNEIVSSYKPNFRYLLTAKIMESYAEGLFYIKDSNSYIYDKLEHVTLSQMSMCLSQLAYVTAYNWIKNNKIKNINKTSLDEFKYLMRKNMLFIESNIRFNKSIPSNSYFIARIDLNSIKTIKNLTLSYFDSSFSDKKGNAKIELALTT